MATDLLSHQFLQEVSVLLLLAEACPLELSQVVGYCLFTFELRQSTHHLRLRLTLRTILLVLEHEVANSKGHVKVLVESAYAPIYHYGISLSQSRA